jgi:glycerate-2-kinase
MIKNRKQLIENGETEDFRLLRKNVLDVIEGVLSAINPKENILKKLRVENEILIIDNFQLQLSEIGKIIVIGGGKAGGSMAEAIETILKNRISKGLVNVLKGTEKNFNLNKIELIGAGHPIPDKDGVKGVKKMFRLVQKLDENDLVITLISGGGSALMPLPVDGINLEALQEITNQLLKSGATINELNAVRKHLSAFKGGQLAQSCKPAKVISLILSDVIGDPLDIIASGPTTPDQSTFQDAKHILEKYKLWSSIPVGIKTRIQQGVDGLLNETPKKNDPIFDKVHNFIIANNSTAAQAAIEKLEEQGYMSLVLSTFVEGEAREVGKVYSSIVQEIITSGRPLEPPCALIIGGETTVTVKGTGKGGRNQEVALSSVKKLSNINCVLATLGTDGIDGPTNVAGALVDGNS